MKFHTLLLTTGDHGKIVLALFIVLVAAKLAAELFEQIHQPPAVGEILAGILVGPSVLNLVQPTDVLDALAEIGVIFLLFAVGLETRPSDIFKVGRTATLVAVLGVVVPFITGFGLLSLWTRELKPFLWAPLWWRRRLASLHVCYPVWGLSPFRQAG